jgi:hypothetical protein
MILDRTSLDFFEFVVRLVTAMGLLDLIRNCAQFKRGQRAFLVNVRDEFPWSGMSGISGDFFRSAHPTFETLVTMLRKLHDSCR